MACLAAFAACAPKPLILKGPRFSPRTPLSEVMKDAGKPNAPSPSTAPQNHVAPANLPAAVANADWPQRMGGPSHFARPVALSLPLKPLWTAPIGRPDDRRHRIVAVPVVAGGRVFTIDSRSTVTATSTAGKTLWTRDVTPPRDRSYDTAGGGLAFGDGRLFVGSGFAELTALDPATGKVLWTQRFNAPLGGTPTVEGHVVYVVTRDGTGWAIDTRDGKVRWQLDGLPSTAGVTGGAGPALSARFAILPFPSGQVLGALKPGGTQIWAQTVAGDRIGQGYASIHGITGDPVVAGGRVYVGNATGAVMALELNTGNLIWSAPHGVTSPVFVAGGSVYLVSDLARLTRLDAKTGKLIWEHQLPYYVPVRDKTNRRDVYPEFGPIVAGGHLVVASGDGHVRLFDPASGKQTGSVALGAGAASDPVVAGGTLYVVTRDGKLHAFR